MQYNYLDILKKYGFKLPQKEEDYDERTQMQLYDKRIPEIQAIIRYAFNGMTLKGTHDQKLFFASLNGTKYVVEITDAGITCTTVKENSLNEMNNQRDFSITKNEEGAYTFTRVEFLDDNKGIIVKKSFVSPPSYYPDNFHTIIDGYDADTLTLFKQYVEQSDPSANYLEILDSFLATTEILPDISRRVLFQEKGSKSSLKEEDLIDTENSWRSCKTISLEESYKVAFPVIESYIRARNYAEQLINARGLSNSIENEIKQRL